MWLLRYYLPDLLAYIVILVIYLMRRMFYIRLDLNFTGYMTRVSYFLPLRFYTEAIVRPAVRLLLLC